MENQIENQGTEIEIKDPKAVLAALEKAKGEAKKYREEKEALEIDLNSSNQMVAEFSGKLLREKTKQAVADLGVKDAQRLMKYIDFSKLEFSSDLEVIGLSDQIDNVKNDLPELFDAKLRVGGQADGAATTVVNTIQSASQLQAKYLLGR
jgi:hypothetical protein